MDKIKEAFENFTLPAYREIPDVGLYLDQVVKYINSSFGDFPDMQVTASMLTNYVKLNIVSRSGKKTYDRNRIAAFIFITMCKSVLSMDNIRVLAEQNRGEKVAGFYEMFRSNMLSVLDALSKDCVSIEKDNSMLSNICIAVGHKMYLVQYFE